MDATQPGLFEETAPEQPRRPPRSQRGRNRQAWVRTVTAEVTVTDADALSVAAARAAAHFVTLEVYDDPDDEVRAPAAHDAGHDGHPLDALNWLLWPTEGLGELLGAGVFLVISQDCSITAASELRATARWTVTVRLTDVDQLRRLAAEASPEAAGQIADSLEAAWLHAADPFAPLRSIPGIGWRPGQVSVEHQPAKARRARLPAGTTSLDLSRGV